MKVAKTNSTQLKRPTLWAGGLIAAAVFFGGAITASAQPLSTNLSFASENFDYPAATGDGLPGSDGGIGWDGAWTTTGGETNVQEPDFDTWPGIFETENLPLALVEADGNVARLDSSDSHTASRDIANVPQAQAGDTFWVSVLTLGDGSSGGNREMRFDMENSVGNSVFGLDVPYDANDTVRLRAGGQDATGTVSPLNDGNRGRWAITQLDYHGGGNADLYLWYLDEDAFPQGGIDIETWLPDTNIADASLSLTGGELGPLNFESFNMMQSDNGSNRIDRINLAHIPEPATVGLLAGLGVLGFVLLRRRSRG